MDFFCHGVPSQRFFRLCKTYVEQKQRMVVTGYAFRTKIKYGATPHYYTITYKRKKRVYKKDKLYIHSPFYLAFQKYISLRESCYACPFSVNRCSDITIGDFHSIDDYISGINRFDGVSTVVINSAKGEALFASVKKGLFCKEIAALAQKLEEREPTAKPKDRECFFADLAQMPFDVFVKKHLNKKREGYKVLYYAMPAFIRRGLKRLLLRG